MELSGRILSVLMATSLVLGAAEIAVEPPPAGKARVTATVSNLVERKTGLPPDTGKLNDPVEKEFVKLLELDDAAQTEVDRWIRENDAFKAQGGGIEQALLNGRITKRFEPVKRAYEDFLNVHPEHARARLAYGSFLNDIHEEEAAQAQWEKARELDPKNPAAWNNLANYYGHNGPVIKAFEYYGKAIELDASESTYYYNLATTVYLFRKDATNYYKLNPQQVFEKAMGLYRKALELDPENFVLATDYAQSYYGFKPTLTGNAEQDRKITQKHCDEALTAWQAAFKLAKDDIERQGVLLHYARLQINADRFEAARTNLNAVSNEMYTTTKKNLLKKLEQRSSGGTNAAPASPTANGSAPNAR
jgi:tetratricopeptide (TPR) repeat protein